jgi:hypothetical protein
MFQIHIFPLCYNYNKIAEHFRSKSLQDYHGGELAKWPTSIQIKEFPKLYNIKNGSDIS